MGATLMPWVAAALFALALVHTFSTKYFERLAHTNPSHAGLWHLLGEVEVVFGFWALVLVLAMVALVGARAAVDYVDTRDFTEPMFVFAIMVISGTRPILALAGAAARAVVRLLPMSSVTGTYLVVLSLVPLAGSFITEPAAMTLAALMLRDPYFSGGVTARVKYATLGVLFVNVSIGGTLTPFAAPPVLMVADAWGWDYGFMLSQFGWKAALVVAVNAIAVTVFARRELLSLSEPSGDTGPQVPLPLIAVHVAFLAAVVASSHYPNLFIGLLLLFLGVASAYERYQDRLMLREGLLVAFFLAGLVVLGGQQQWWLQPLLMSMSSEAVFAGALVLTAFTDNAALTYLGSLVPGLTPEFQYALVAGAVAGGGLTVVANAPNPAGVALLRARFADGSVHPLGLLAGAALPTLVAALGFRFL